MDTRLWDGPLSIGRLIRHFWRQVSITWMLTIFETMMLASLPLLIGRSIDGLLSGVWTPFLWLLLVMSVLLGLSVIRRIYDTRAYGTMRLELGVALTTRSTNAPVSKLNARLDMSRELVDFLELEAPLVITALIQVAVSLLILFSFHAVLAGAAFVSVVLVLMIYGGFSSRFFRLNHDLNSQKEQQVRILDARLTPPIRTHLSALRHHEIRISDTEAIVYGLIFAALMAMLSFNLWFAATQNDATSGQIFSIVTYSYEFMESAVILPATLQSMTRISEITTRINTHLPTNS